jgi:hypothetical protein
VGKREKIVKTKLRIPRGLLKDLEQYASDNDLKVSEVAMLAFNEFLTKGKNQR